ncbi:MAG TPA: GNAT family N-acetyltransferase [Rubrivivax sp.]|nr:GNAT family N-acetyltransferase [Rubrivivax sp.]
MQMKIHRLAGVSAVQIDQLAEVLHDCVHGGASVSFMLPFPIDEARRFWQAVAQGVERGERLLIVGEAEGRIFGTVQLVLAQPPNQPHRADLAKMLVHRTARGRGLGALLLQAAEQAARDCGKTLLVLDTASADAERLYERAGWVRCGRVPGYALLPDGGLCDTHFFFRQLAPVAAQ